MAKKVKVILVSDGYRIAGPRIDGTYSVTFTFGEYMLPMINELLKHIEPNRMTFVEVTKYTGKEPKWRKKQKRKEKVKSVKSLVAKP